MTTATVLHWTTESLVYVCRVSAIRFSAAGLSPPCFPLTGSWKPPFCTGQKNIMTTNIAVVAECLKYEADEYKKRYDEIHSTLFFFYRCVAIPSYVKLLFVSFYFEITALFSLQYLIQYTNIHNNPYRKIATPDVMYPITDLSP